MPSPATTRLAVLIDADNTSATYASALLEEIARYGVPTVKRAYGDWTTQSLVRWKDELNKHAIQPVQQFAYTTGKNSTDSALIIDAMDLLYSGNLDAFAIVSSDSDFTRLATRLRESGKIVYGLGRSRTPPSLVAACDKFIFLEVLGDQLHTDGAVSKAEASVPLPDLRKILMAAINGTSHEDRWASLAAVGSHINKNNPSFDPRNYGFAKLVELARAQSFVDLDQTPSGGVRIRLRSARPQKQAPAQKTPAKKATAKKSPAKKAQSS